MIQQQTKVKGINCIYLPATDIREAANWYINNLNLELLNEVNETSTQAQLKINSHQTIFLIKTENSHNLTYTEVEGHEQCIITLEVTNIYELHEKLKDNNLIGEIIDNDECGLSFFVKDPDGNLIEIWGGWAQAKK
ncbi:VOC family protein [Sutcliffiella sp. NPDC057660]|uniref:VOC family protein n=1 Tax=Sutcliffiella sp. NPDC057660 TaxID=3346199 RepID=UPI00367E1310